MFNGSQIKRDFRPEILTYQVQVEDTKPSLIRCLLGTTQTLSSLRSSRAYFQSVAFAEAHKDKETKNFNASRYIRIQGKKVV